MDHLLARYPPGYVEILGSVSIQVIYILFGLAIEAFVRPSYKSSTTPKMLVDSMRNHVVATGIHVAYVFFNDGKSVLTRTFSSSPSDPSSSSSSSFEFPSLFEMTTHLVMGLLLRDVVFWIIHRAWHLPILYKAIHAKHHEVVHPAEHHILTISYMSVVDFVFLYGFPVVMVAKTIEMNLVTTLVFAFFSAAGEQVKLVFGDEGHDAHHLVCSEGEDGEGGEGGKGGKVGNFGAYGFMDWVLGTDGSGDDGYDAREGKGKGKGKKGE